MKTIPTHLIEKTESCWIWLGRVNEGGYGCLGRSALAHRAVYTAARGEIPQGLELDHLCRNTACVNPDHLEPVTGEENRRRKYALITSWKSGHPYDADNTYRRPDGTRDCRTCIRVRVRKYRARRLGRSAA